MKQGLDDSTWEAYPPHGEHTRLGSILARILSLGTTELDRVRAHRAALHDDSPALRRRVEARLGNRLPRWGHPEDGTPEQSSDPAECACPADAEIGRASCRERVLRLV